jgi:hypothetical protein
MLTNYKQSYTVQPSVMTVTACMSYLKMTRINQGLAPVFGTNGMVSRVLSVKLAKKLRFYLAAKGQFSFLFLYSLGFKSSAAVPFESRLEVQHRQLICLVSNCLLYDECMVNH